MTYRITEKMLETRVAHLNKITNSPAEYRGADSVIAIGHFHLSHAYGGVCLHKVCNTSGGVSDVLSMGHVTKREAFDRICAFTNGIEYSNQ